MSPTVYGVIADHTQILLTAGHNTEDVVFMVFCWPRSQRACGRWM